MRYSLIFTLLALISIALFTTSTPLQAEDHFALLPDSTVMAVTFHSAEEVRAFWNLPEMQNMLAMFPEEAWEEFNWDYFNNSVQTVMGSTAEDILADLDGAITFAFTDFDFTTMDMRPTVMLDFGKNSARIESLFATLESHSEETAVEMKMDRTIISGRLVFTFEGMMAMTRVDNSIVIYPSTQDSVPFSAPAASLAANPELQLQQRLVGLDRGISFFVNVEALMNSFSAAYESMGSSNNGMLNTVHEMFALMDLYSIKSAAFRGPLTEGDSVEGFIHAPGYDGILADLFADRPVANRYFSSIHDEYDAAAAISVHNFKTAFERILQRLSEHFSQINTEEVYAQLADFEKESGVHIVNDFLANMGEFVGFAFRFEKGKAVSMFGNPLMLLASMNYEIQIGVVDAAALVEAIDLLEASTPGGPSLEKDTHKDAVVYTPKDSGPIDFSMAITGDTLYAGFISADAMKDTLDKVEQKKLLPEMAVLTLAASTIPSDAMTAAATTGNYYRRYAELFGSFGEYEPADDSLAKIQQVIAAIPDTAPMKSYYQVRDGGLYAYTDFSVRGMLGLIHVEMIKALAFFEPIEQPREPVATEATTKEAK